MAPKAGPFPSGVYGKYKRATACFLEWLLRARVAGGFGALETNTPTNSQPPNVTNETKKKPTPMAADTVSEYARIVTAIAQEPASLPDPLRRRWPVVKAACECAITLRAEVAQFFPLKPGHDSHRHFLEQLTTWYHQLRDANVGRLTNDDKPSVVPTPSDANGKKLDFSNYYDVLDLPDDFFDEDQEATITVNAKAASSRPLTAGERKRLREEPFRDDASLEVAYFLLELDELSEAVYTAFHDVKLQKKTLFEASVVVDVAADFARRLTAQFQLQHPQVRDVADFSRIMLTHIPFAHAKEVAARIGESWRPTRKRRWDSDPPPKYQYVRGAIMLDVLWLDLCLGTVFDTMRPGRMNEEINLDEVDSLLGEPYHEEHTQHYTIPAFLPPMEFFLQQLTQVYNEFVYARAAGIPLESIGYSEVFFQPLVQFFQTKKVTLDVMFVCICWVRSVSALQGDAGLRRTMSLSLMHQWNLEARLRDAIAVTSRQSRRDEWLYKELQWRLHGMVSTEKLTALTHANPILAGGLMQLYQFNYLHVGAQLSGSNSRLRAFCHIYSALRDRKLLDEIPLFEDIITHYEHVFFMPSRAAAVHGAYMRVYRASSQDPKLTARSRQKEQKRHEANCHCLQCMSPVLRLLDSHDYSELPPQVLKATSWRARLEGVSDMCSKELFGSRVLSRDMLRISYDLMSLFIMLRDYLCGQSEFTSLLDETDVKKPIDRAADQALEDVVVSPLLPLLDKLNADGSAKMTVLKGASRSSTTIASPEMGTLALYYCQRAADIISAHFKVSNLSLMESRYYTLPATPNWATLEFGDTLRGPYKEWDDTIETFKSLMKMIEASPGPLTDEQVTRLKEAVKDDPNLLSKAVEDHTVELCTLFHHVAAGRVRDRRLVEWFIQMGALDHQPCYFHDPIPSSRWRSHLTDMHNYMAVHSAAKAGLKDVVRMILEADDCRDVNKLTFVTKESLAHIAVRNGDRVMFDLLDDLGVEVCHKDVQGKYLHDLTTDAEWKRELLSMEIWEHTDAMEDEAPKQKKKEKPKGIKVQLSASRKSLSTTTSSSSVISAKKLVKKKPVAPRLTLEDRAMTSLIREFAQLQDQKTAASAAANASPPLIQNDERILQLTEWLDTLKGNHAAVGAAKRECEEAATGAIHVIDDIRANVQQCVESRNLDTFSRDVVLREASDASRVLFLLSKHYRQLPAPKRDLPQDDSATGKLTQRAGPALAFGDFLSFAMRTVSLFQQYNRMPQAHEVLELVERRLLKHKPRDPKFCETVKAYLAERQRLDLEPTTGSLAEARLVFKWILPKSDSGVSNIDALVRYPWFRRMDMEGAVTPDALQTLFEHVVVHLPSDKSILYLHSGRTIVVASRSSVQLSRAADMVASAASRSGVRLRSHSTADNTTRLVVDGLDIAQLAAPGG